MAARKRHSRTASLLSLLLDLRVPLIVAIRRCELEVGDELLAQMLFILGGSGEALACQAKEFLGCLRLLVFGHLLLFSLRFAVPAKRWLFGVPEAN